MPQEPALNDTVAREHIITGVVPQDHYWEVQYGADGRYYLSCIDWPFPPLLGHTLRLFYHDARVSPTRHFGTRLSILMSGFERIKP